MTRIRCLVVCVALVLAGCGETEPDPKPAAVDKAPVEALTALGKALEAKDWAAASAFLTEEWVKDVSPGDPKTEGYWRVLVADTSATDTRWVWSPVGPETTTKESAAIKDGEVAVRLEHKNPGAFDDSRPAWVVLRKTGDKWLLAGTQNAEWKPPAPAKKEE